MYGYVGVFWLFTLAFAFFKGYAYHDQSREIKLLKAENQRLVVSQTYYKHATEYATELNKQAEETNRKNEAIIDDLKSVKDKVVSKDNCDKSIILDSVWLRKLDTIK